MNDLMQYRDADINEAVGICEKFVTDLDTIMDEATAAVKQRAEASSGEIAAAFTIAQDKLRESQDGIKITVGNFAGALANASSTMSATDRRFASQLDALG